MSPKELYIERIKTLTDEIYQLNKHNRLVIVLELMAIALAVGCIVAYTMWSSIVALVVTALFIAAYVAIRWKDSNNSRLSEQKESIRSVYQKEVAYLNGDFSGFPSGEQYVNPHHEFTLDLDIFGPQSLFNRINRTVTTGGSDFLAKELGETRVRSIDEIEKRHEAIRELSEKESLRTAFLAQGRGRQINTTAIMEALQEVQQLHISHLAAHKLIFIAWFVGRSCIWTAVCFVAHALGAATDYGSLSSFRSHTKTHQPEHQHHPSAIRDIRQHDYADSNVRLEES